MQSPPSLHEILEARRRIAPYLSPTPLYESRGLSHFLGCRIFVKHENHQPVGAFKVRGGINLIAQLNPDERSRGVISASTGNHGQSVAYAARLFGVAATIVVPRGSNPDKVSAIETLGAAIEVYGKDFDEAREHAELLARERNLRYVHSANEPHLIAGVGTIGIEILEQLPAVDVIIVPVGGGSGASGICLAVKSQMPGVQVIGVQSAAAPAAYLSWKAKQPVASDVMETFAEGLATRVGFQLTVSILIEYLNDFILVSDDEIRNAMILMMQHTHNLVEAAGAAPLAAALRLAGAWKGKNVVLIQSGGNITLAALHELLSSRLHPVSEGMAP